MPLSIYVHAVVAPSPLYQCGQNGFLKHETPIATTTTRSAPNQLEGCTVHQKSRFFDDLPAD